MSPPLPQRLIALACLALALMWPAWGDDTEIYWKGVADPIPNVLLIIETSERMRLESNQTGRATSTSSFLGQTVRNARELVRYYLQDDAPPVRIGLMRYSGEGGELLVPIKSLDETDSSGVPHSSNLLTEMVFLQQRHKLDWSGPIETCRPTLSGRGDDPEACPTASTPSTELLADHTEASTIGVLNEAWKYFKGEIDGKASPIEHECQENHVIVFTDGVEENEGPVSNRTPEDLRSGPVCRSNPPPPLHPHEGDLYCVAAMTEYMNEMDARSNLDGTQNINTHFIQVYGTSGTLRAPNTPLAESLRSIPSAYERVINAVRDSGGVLILSNANTFQGNQAPFLNHLSTPAPPIPLVPIGSLVRIQRQESGQTQFDDRIYFGIFQPEIRSGWLGNLKKYGLHTDDQGRILYIADDTGEPAIDEQGKFKETATSYWHIPGRDISPHQDGNKPAIGGAAERLTDYENLKHSTDRRVYTWNPETETEFPIKLSRIMPAGTSRSNDYFVAYRFGLIRPGGGGLIHHTLDLNRNPSDRVASCSSTPLPGSDENGRRFRRGLALANWILGMDVCDEDDYNGTTGGRPRMGAVLHGRPEVVSFGGDIGDVMLVLSNNGYMHMIQVNEPPLEQGSQKTPKLELASIFLGTQLVGEGLDKTYNIFENLNGSPLHALDGDITVRVEHDADGDVEKAIAYFGQRRGGRNLFAIDLGDPSNFDNNPPELLWHVRGGANGEFENVGQTWSTPKHTTIKGTDDTIRDVVIFGGGYDPAVDCQTFADDNRDCMDTSRPRNQYGNSIYIVDADNGDLLWQATGKDIQSQGTLAQTVGTKYEGMRYSFPAPVRLVENSNGLTEKFFAIDSGGLVWRFDIDNNTTPDSTALKIDGGIVADLYGGNNTSVEHHRRFYNTPGVSYSTDANGDRELRVTVGSGYRAHPLDKNTQDRMYSFVQPIAAPEEYAKKRGDCGSNSDCFVIRNLFELDRTPADNKSKLKKGWFLNLDKAAGEKVLSDAVTLLGVTLFTTYTPPAEAPLPCQEPDLGTNKLYAVDHLSGSATLNLGADDVAGTSGEEFEISIPINTQGIAPSPEILFDSFGAQTLVGTDLIETSRIQFNETGRQLLYWAQDERE